MEYQPKSNEKPRPFLIVFQALKVIYLFKEVEDTSTSSLYISYCFTLALTSADLILHKF